MASWCGLSILSEKRPACEVGLKERADTVMPRSERMDKKMICSSNQPEDFGSLLGMDCLKRDKSDQANHEQKIT